MRVVSRRVRQLTSTRRRNPVPADSSISHLLKDVLRDVTSLVQNEIRLGRAELKLGMEDARAGLTQLGLAVAFAIPAITLLGGAAALALGELGISLMYGLMLVGGILALLAVAMLFAARRNVGSDNTRLRETTENLERDAETLKETLS